MRWVERKGGVTGRGGLGEMCVEWKGWGLSVNGVEWIGVWSKGDLTKVEIRKVENKILGKKRNERIVEQKVTV